MAIDLRSDTVTRPDAGMRHAMVHAEVGDDVLGDDPTVRALEERMADLLGTEAALFTPSGTMANQLALRCLTEPGDEVLLDVNAHILNYQSGAGAALSGLQFRTLDAPAGGFTSAELRPLRRPNHHEFPHTALVSMENTHNHRGGEVFDLERMRDVRRWADDVGLRVHLDGARLWNASVASGVPPREYAACAHTTCVCFSKGLGAPVGSVLAGEATTVARARRFRRMFGGGMRQAGILAAAALYALDHNLERLGEDHHKAQRLAETVERCAGLRLARPVETNILIVEVTSAEDSAAQLVADLQRSGVLAGVWEERSVRLVTHRDIAPEEVERAAETLVELRG